MFENRPQPLETGMQHGSSPKPETESEMDVETLKRAAKLLEEHYKMRADAYNIALGQKTLRKYDPTLIDREQLITDLIVSNDNPRMQGQLVDALRLMQREKKRVAGLIEKEISARLGATPDIGAKAVLLERYNVALGIVKAGPVYEAAKQDMGKFRRDLATETMNKTLRRVLIRSNITDWNEYVDYALYANEVQSGKEQRKAEGKEIQRPPKPWEALKQASETQLAPQVETEEVPDLEGEERNEETPAGWKRTEEFLAELSANPPAKKPRTRKRVTPPWEKTLLAAMPQPEKPKLPWEINYDTTEKYKTELVQRARDEMKQKTEFVPVSSPGSNPVEPYQPTHSEVPTDD